MSVQLQQQIEVLAPDTVVGLPAKKGPHRFLPGQSGNPNGRPKESYRISDLAKEHTQQALDTLVEICTDKEAPPNARVTAAECLLNRAWGKAPVQIESKNVTGGIQDWQTWFESSGYRESDQCKRIEATMEEARRIEAERDGRHR